MSKIASLYLLLCCALFSQAQAQENKLQKYRIVNLVRGPVKSIRGMSVPTDSLIWVSGTGGMVGKSTDGGQHWEWIQVPGCDSCDWRGIEAFNSREALVVNAGEPAHIFRTSDGGKTWERVYFNDTKGIFLDGMAFRSPREGWVIGDPLEGKFTILYTRDGGRNWTPANDAPAAYKGEAVFAASGSSLLSLPENVDYFVTGGDTARFFTRHKKGQWQPFAMPVIQGSASTGAFSIAARTSGNAVVVGGDYRNDTLRRQNCALTTNGGKTWINPQTPPSGFRSAVTFIDDLQLVATGTSGTDVSLDAGRNWRPVSPEGFHVVQRARKGKTVYLAGSEGRIAKLVEHP